MKGAGFEASKLARPMSNFEDKTCAFIVRFWLERREIETGDVELRGVVEHVPSGQRRYVLKIGDVLAFMTSYLEAMGVTKDVQ